MKVNNREAGTHKGGYTAFDVDITPYIIKGNNTITVCELKMCLHLWVGLIYYFIQCRFP
ncbi:sugar-binding domain-containing protein [Gillisia sp. JM1]|uniref:sugar-binding domain-containing protein n=1 Tax=Gillisia sp. JM1 TaxID=1283286 RepID=UPI0009DC3D5D